MLYKVFSKLSVLKLKPDSLNDYPDTEGCSYGSKCYFNNQKILIHI